MKRFIKKILLFIIALAIISIGVSVTIDPFNVFHPLSVKSNGIEPNKNYIKMTYILNNPNKFDTLVFGSSRVGNIHVNNMWEHNAYNMTYSEALPCEILANLHTLIDNNVSIKEIFVGVDNLSYTIDPASHNTVERASYEYAKSNPIGFYSLYLDPAMSIKSYLTVIISHYNDTDFTTRFYDYGWNSDYGSTTTYDFNNPIPNIGSGYYLEDTLQDIKDIVDLCKTNNIKVTIFTNPTYYVTYDAALKQNYIEFLRKLAEITEFCNFSGYNAVSTDSSYWIDTSHYNAEASDMVLECMAFHAYYEGLYEEGFGYWVNSDNIDYFINILSESRAKYEK